VNLGTLTKDPSNQALPVHRKTEKRKELAWQIVKSLATRSSKERSSGTSAEAIAHKSKHVTRETRILSRIVRRLRTIKHLTLGYTRQSEEEKVGDRSEFKLCIAVPHCNGKRSTD
jgi:hypothetical protein